MVINTEAYSCDKVIQVIQDEEYCAGQIDKNSIKNKDI